jgi:hypothetical protein
MKAADKAFNCADIPGARGCLDVFQNHETIIFDCIKDEIFHYIGVA